MIPFNRQKLIGQLRTLLHLAESPKTDVVEGDVGHTDISVEVLCPIARRELIGAMRHTLSDATQPHSTSARFDHGTIKLRFKFT